MRNVTIYIKGVYSHTMTVNKAVSNDAVLDLLLSQGLHNVTVVG